VRRAVDCFGMDAMNQEGKPQADIILQNMVRVKGSRGGTVDATPYAESINSNITSPFTDFWNKGLCFQAGIVVPRDLAPQLPPLVASGRVSPSSVTFAVIQIRDAADHNGQDVE
jgi:threonine dehydrogenase-like Zn-dependent dehydrogenase